MELLVFDKNCFQLKLPSQPIIPGGLIDILNRGKLKQPTTRTVKEIVRLNARFDDLHGRGTSLRETRQTELKTVRFLTRRCPDIDLKIIKVFVKTKYNKKIRDRYEEILMQRRIAAKKRGKKLKTNRCHVKDGHLRCQVKETMNKTDIASFYKEMFDVGDDADEAVLPAAPTAEEEEVENRVLASAVSDNDGYVAAEETETVTEVALPALASNEAIGEVAETETGTEAALPTLASSEAIGEVAETVTEAQDRSGPALDMPGPALDMPGPALATEPRKKRGKGPKKAAEEESKEKDIAAKKAAPKKRGRKAAAVAAPNKEEEEKLDAKRGRKATASVEEEIRIESHEEKRAEEAPELAVLEPEVSSSTK